MWAPLAGDPYPHKMPHCQGSEGYTPGPRDLGRPDSVQPISPLPRAQPPQPVLWWGSRVPGMMGRPQAAVASPLIPVQVVVVVPSDNDSL